MPEIAFPDCESQVEDLLRREGLMQRLEKLGPVHLHFGEP